MWPWRRTESTGEREQRTQARAHDRAIAWQQCVVCSYDIRTGEGERNCHYYACPLLPEELDVFCPTCNYDFYTREGSPECGPTPRCDYARTVAPRRVATVREWWGQQGTEIAR